MKQRERAARFGPAYRFGGPHGTDTFFGHEPTTTSRGEHWPTPCSECVRRLTDPSPGSEALVWYTPRHGHSRPHTLPTAVMERMFGTW